jgi:hypothetical protein
VGAWQVQTSPEAPWEGAHSLDSVPDPVPRAGGVIMRLKRDPCVTGTQGDCRGGNKTKVKSCSSAANINLTKL